MSKSNSNKGAKASKLFSAALAELRRAERAWREHYARPSAESFDAAFATANAAEERADALAQRADALQPGKEYGARVLHARKYPFLPIPSAKEAQMYGDRY